MSTVDCQANPDAGADASALMVATLPGRDAGTSALVHGLNRLPGVGVRGGEWPETRLSKQAATIRNVT